MSNEAPIFYNPHDHYKVRKKKTDEVLVEREFETLPEPPRLKTDPDFDFTYKPGEFRPNKTNEWMDRCAGCGQQGKTHKKCTTELLKLYIETQLAIVDQMDEVTEELEEGIPAYLKKEPRGGMIFETNKLRRKIKQKGIWIEKEEIH